MAPPALHSRLEDNALLISAAILDGAVVAVAILLRPSQSS
jgi:hypothetical protein